MMHKSAWETDARAEGPISSLSRQPDSFCIPSGLTTLVQKEWPVFLYRAFTTHVSPCCSTDKIYLL